MPVILGPDGPSLGGFVCPATIVQAELWKMGQLRPGDLVRFRAISRSQAAAMEEQMEVAIADLRATCPALPGQGCARRSRSCRGAGRREKGRLRSSAGRMATGICWSSTGRTCWT